MKKPKLYTRCLRCNRKLKTESAMLRGYGDCCWKRIQLEKKQLKKTIFQIMEESTKK